MGDELPLELGIQGGYHTWIALHATDLDTRDPWRVELRGLWGGTVTADARPQAGATCDRSEGLAEAVGLQLIWVPDPAAIPSLDDLDGEAVEVDVVVTDAAGASVSARSPEVTLVAP